MKLLHITATHLNPAGGIPVVLKNLVEEQNKITGFEARVLSLKVDVSKIDSPYFDYIDGKTYDGYFETYTPDIVIFHSHYYFEYIKFSEYLINKRIPYLIEPHGSFGKAALNKSKIKKFVANNVVFREYLKKANGFVFLNKQEMVDSRYVSENDIIIPNGIVINGKGFFVAPQSPWYFYFIGRFDINHKGLDYLFSALEIIDARKRMINIKFYGTGSSKEISYINSQISKYKYVKAVNCGEIYGNEQAKELEQKGVMLLTSRYEGFPMTVLEAWKYGNPCIVTPGTNVCNEISKNSIGWCVSLDPQSIADGIIKAAQEYEDNRNEMIMRCKDYSNSYSWSSIALKSKQELEKKLKCIP